MSPYGIKFGGQIWISNDKAKLEDVRHPWWPDRHILDETLPDGRHSTEIEPVDLELVATLEEDGYTVHDLDFEED